LIFRRTRISGLFYKFEFHDEIIIQGNVPMNINKKIVALTLMAFQPLLLSTSVSATTSQVLPGRESAMLPRTSMIEWSENDTIGLLALTDNSYYCAGIGGSVLDSFRFKSAIGNFTGTTVFRGDTLGSASAPANQSLALIANSSNNYILSLDSGMTSEPGGTQPSGYIFCKNSTLAGNFNTVTAANPVNFLELTNSSATSLNALVVIRSFTGVELDRRTVQVPAQSRRDIGIHEIENAGNTFGSVQVAHDGALGSLAANVSKYKFDGVTLDITATEPLKLKDQ
jgi:hypothetical protein